MEKKLEKFIHYISRNFLSYWIILGFDIAIAILSTFITYIGIHYIIGANWECSVLCELLVVSFLFTLAGSFILRSYRNTIRYSEVKDLWRVTCVTLVKALGIGFYIFLFREDNLYNSQNVVYLLFDSLLTLALMVFLRVLMIIVYESLLGYFSKTHTAARILICGTDERTVGLRLRLRNSEHYKVVGFCYYSNHTDYRRLSDLPIYTFGSQKRFSAIAAKHKIEGVLFASKELLIEEEDRLLAYCKEAGIKALIAPSISEADNNGTFRQFIRPIRIEDLLGREEININMKNVASEFSGKVILVTGAAGSIGSELCRQLAGMGIKKLIMFDSAETPLHNIRLEFEKEYPELDFVPVIGDVRLKDRIRMVFEMYHPQIVFHAAAYKHVPLMEENPCEAVLVNVIGSRQVADIAVEYGAEKMIMISTDKAVNPTNVMGCSKRLAEIYVQSLGCAIREGKVAGKTKFITTRFGNVLGSNGSVIPHFRDQIENGGPVTVTHPDIIRFFMTIPEACRLVMEAGTMGKGNEIFVFEMGEPVKIVDLATRMIELAGYKPGIDIQIEFTGLRPGEKLYEEVLSDEENTIPTANKKIMVAKVRKYPYGEILPAFDHFEELSRGVEVMKTVGLMKELVPEYISKNSKFEVLDKKKTVEKLVKAEVKVSAAV